MESIDGIIEKRILDISMAYEKRLQKLEEEVKELNRALNNHGAWIPMKEVEKRFGISRRTQYRKMNHNEFKWKKPNGGQRLILVESIFMN